MKRLIFIIVAIFIFSSDVNAYSYIQPSSVNISDEAEVIGIDMSGNDVSITKAYEDRDENIILLASYREENSEYKDNNYIIPGADGGGINGSSGGTPVRKHAKIIKLDSSYKKLWETSFYQQGNWENSNATADTVQTSFLDIAQLSDGSYILVGEIHGLVRTTNAQSNDDDFDAMMIRVDTNGNIIHKASYYNQGVDSAIIARALKDGGYIVKFYCVFTQNEDGSIKKPTDFPATDTNSSYYYVVYNNNNEIIDSFPGSKVDNLNNYSFMNSNDKYDLKYTIKSTYEYKTKSKYFGTTINNNSIFMRDSHLTIVDAETGEEKKSFWVEMKSIEFSKMFMMTNDGGFIYDKVLYNGNGEKIRDFNDKTAKTDPQYYDYVLPLSNGDVLKLTSKAYGKKILVNKSNGSQGDIANFVISGRKITSNLGTFIEKDRTYINLNNFCSIMDCKYVRDEKDNNKLIIDFNMFTDNNMVSASESSNSRISERIKYTIVHEIGSKKFTTYLSMQPYKIFRLNSPFYTEDAVDVQSKEIDGQIYVPLRFISEALGRYVNYEPNGENNKPTITIGAYGEGDFFEKYSTAISYDKLNENDQLSNIIKENSLELQWGLEKPVYGYGYIKAENRVVSVDKTIFVPTQDKLLGPNILVDYSDKESDGIQTNHYQFLSFESKDNWIGKQEMYHDNNGTAGDKYYGSGEYESFMLVSNIEGYPFIKILNFK